MMSGIEFISKVRSNPFANDYAEVAAAGHFWVKWRFEVFKRLVPPEYMRGDIFDIGCGNGVVAAQVEGVYEVNVSGTDLDLNVLKRVKPQRGTVYYYDIQECSEALEGRFSAAILMDVLEHVAEPRQFLEAVRFHLKNNGVVIVNVPAWNCLYSSFDKIQGHVKRYAMDALKQELGDAGFDCVDGTYWGMSLLPAAFFRKYFLWFFPEKEAFKLTYPSSPLLDYLMGILMRLELLFGSHWPFGSSIMVVAVKRS